MKLPWASILILSVVILGVDQAKGHQNVPDTTRALQHWVPAVSCGESDEGLRPM